MNPSASSEAKSESRQSWPSMRVGALLCEKEPDHPLVTIIRHYT